MRYLLIAAGAGSPLADVGAEDVRARLAGDFRVEHVADARSEIGGVLDDGVCRCGQCDAGGCRLLHKPSL